MAGRSNSGGHSGTSPFSKGGSARVNGQQRGAGRGEGVGGGAGHGDKGSAAVRPNGRQRAGDGGDGENQNYRQSYKRNSETIKPTKSGGVR